MHGIKLYCPVLDSIVRYETLLSDYNIYIYICTQLINLETQREAKPLNFRACQNCRGGIMLETEGIFAAQAGGARIIKLETAARDRVLVERDLGFHSVTAREKHHSSSFLDVG